MAAIPRNVDSGTPEAGSSSIPAPDDHKHVLANLGVATAKIADLAVTNAKIANRAVTTLKISDGVITNIKIANGTIDLTTKATYIAVNKGGDTMTGDLIHSGSNIRLKTTAGKERIFLYGSDGRIFLKDTDGVTERIELDPAYRKRIWVKPGTRTQTYDAVDGVIRIENWTSGDHGDLPGDTPTYEAHAEAGFLVQTMNKSGRGTVNIFQATDCNWSGNYPSEFGFFIGGVTCTGSGSATGNHARIIMQGTGGVTCYDAEIQLKNASASPHQYGFLARSTGTVRGRSAFQVIPNADPNYNPGYRWGLSFVTPEGQGAPLGDWGEGGAIHIPNNKAIILSNDQWSGIVYFSDIGRISIFHQGYQHFRVDGSGAGVPQGDKLYLNAYNQASPNTYFTFDGSRVRLIKNGVEVASW